MEIIEVTHYLIYDDGDYLGEFEEEEDALKELKNLKEFDKIELPCTFCKFSTQREENCNVVCHCSNLKVKDLHFVSPYGLGLFDKFDLDPILIDSCKKRRVDHGN